MSYNQPQQKSAKNSIGDSFYDQQLQIYNNDLDLDYAASQRTRPQMKVQKKKKKIAKQTIQPKPVMHSIELSQPHPSVTSEQYKALDQKIQQCMNILKITIVKLSQERKRQISNQASKSQTPFENNIQPSKISIISSKPDPNSKQQHSFSHSKITIQNFQWESFFEDVAHILGQLKEKNLSLQSLQQSYKELQKKNQEQKKRLQQLQKKIDQILNEKHRQDFDFQISIQLPGLVKNAKNQNSPVLHTSSFQNQSSFRLPKTSRVRIMRQSFGRNESNIIDDKNHIKTDSNDQRSFSCREYEKSQSLPKILQQKRSTSKKMEFFKFKPLQINRQNVIQLTKQMVRVRLSTHKS